MRYYKKWLVACLMIIAGSCTKTFLDREPLTQPTTTSFWKTEKDMETALVGCYATLGFYITPNTFIIESIQHSIYLPSFFDGLSDDGVGVDDTGLFLSQKVGYSGLVFSFMDEVYEKSYLTIASTNTFLANVDRIENLNIAKKNRAVAEIKFLRAFQYYRLAVTFGNVPLVLSNPADEDFDNPPSNSIRASLLAQVRKDLDEVIKDLPVETYNGHIGKAGALLLKMHLLMFEKKFSEAAVIGADLYKSVVHRLSPRFRDNFVKPGQINNSEILFSITWNPPVTAQGYLSLDQAIARGFSCTPAANLVDEYETINGQLPSEDPAFNPTRPYVNRDARLKMTVFCPGDYKGYLDYSAPTSDTIFLGVAEQGATGPQDGYFFSPTGFRLRKFLTANAITVGQRNTSTQDWVVFRYADALLLYAEALNESAPGHADIAAAVNKVRARVGMPPLPPTLSQLQMRERIRRERRVELAFENIRYFDLRRWGIAQAKLNGLKLFDPSMQHTEPPNVYKAHYEYWPIPLRMYDRNKKLVQNPGYPPF